MAARVITIRVNGIPAPQGSKRHVGKGRMVEQSKAVGPWREAVRSEVQRVKPAVGDIENREWMSFIHGCRVSVVFVFPRPASHYGSGKNAGTVRQSAPHRPAVRPDLDKLVRSTLDGLVMGNALRDDAHVVSLTASKIYADDGAEPGALITLEAC